MTHHRDKYKIFHSNKLNKFVFFYANLIRVILERNNFSELEDFWDNEDDLWTYYTNYI